MLDTVIRIACRNIYKVQYSRRFISLTSVAGGYIGDGNTTTIDVWKNDTDFGMTLNGFSEVGFRLNDDLIMLGSMAIFPKAVLSWNVHHINDITEETLTLFTVLQPKLDVLIIGVGDKVKDLRFHQKLFPFLKKHKINLEISDTEQACATFNYLNSRCCSVAAALIAPQKIELTDFVKSREQCQTL